MRSDVMNHRQNPTEYVFVAVPLVPSKHKQILLSGNSEKIDPGGRAA